MRCSVINAQLRISRGKSGNQPARRSAHLRPLKSVHVSPFERSGAMLGQAASQSAPRYSERTRRSETSYRRGRQFVAK
jgi:hypothetical protein